MWSHLLLFAAAATGVAAIWLERNERRHTAFYALKPLTTLLIGAAAGVALRSDWHYQAWVLAALVLSLAGDVCLMFEDERWFVAGLSSFLLAHAGFVAAFLSGVSQVELPGWLALVVLYAAVLLWAMLPRAGALKLPVLLYCVVLGAMVFAAAARFEALPGRASRLALAGALLFLFSDSALGLRRFVRRYRHAQPVILATYWTAIGLIAASV
ncbi:MAG TPA: lysoplasmalogenase [Candidatus Binatia bacterium]|nr:lysoplasmalogenase [Candidatus Binatia bacterium]